MTSISISTSLFQTLFQRAPIMIWKEQKFKIGLLQEPKAYLLEDCNNDSTLEWWHYNRFRYPNIARVAHKRLAVTATLTPSKRVFLICGLVDTCK